MPLEWSAPAANQGISPAEAQARFQLHAAPIAGVLDSIMRERMMQQQQLNQDAQGAIKGIAGVMQQKKADDIAQTLLDNASNYDNESPTPDEAMARQLNESNARPSDAWHALETAKAQNIKQALDTAHTGYFNRLSNVGNQPVVDPNTGMIWNGKQWVKDPTQKPDEWDAAVPVARGKLDADGQFTNQYTGAETGDQVQLMTPKGKTVVVPWNSYQARVNGIAQPAAAPPTPAAQNEVVRITKDGRRAVFDSTTKQFIRFDDDADDDTSGE